MVLRLIEEDWPLDEIVFFDGGWEFPQMYEHIDKVENYIGREITRLKPRQPFGDEMLNRNPLEGSNRTWIGWPSIKGRWCTSIKARVISKYVVGSMQYIGIASDEASRMSTSYLSDKYKLFPLVDWDMDEADCLAYCRERGFDWDGLYDIFPRVSCYCCPLQRIGQLRNLRRHFPELWAQMLAWDAEIGVHNRGFRGYDTVHDLECRFADEDRQMCWPFNERSMT